MGDTFKIYDIFAENVFTTEKLKEHLPKHVFADYKQLIECGGQLTMEDADVIAQAMKEWAESKGATHYTHWFQPLTVSISAEKHDSFVANPDESGKEITAFTGKELIMGEPDASSFPSGGLRETCAARGYTAWDCTSPVFLKEDGAGLTLCIPTVFCSYTGESLDKKTPLLRSMEAVSKEAMRIVKLFNPETEATKVVASVGPEQEYFIIDRQKLLARKDLRFTGRTLFGAPAPKGQELEDSYFSPLTDRVGEFMKDLNKELWKLGITATTQHNEVAPSQHELAPIYATANVAVDNNILVMELMDKVAERHGLACLLHEKPFDGINGSGKHNNWSLGTDLGENLFKPGKTPNKNRQFLLILSCIIKAVRIHADLLRQSAADVGNDHRLGANEAPPAIISIFLGEQLDDIVNQIIKTGTAATCLDGQKLDLGVSTLPILNKDATDRNRTSPFAFTGNKFEFRMVGSMDSIGSPNTTLNAIAAEAFQEAADELEGAADFEKACDELIARNFREHEAIIFNGNGYSDEWVAEAEKRGLPNLKSLVASTESLITDKAVDLFGKFGIYTKTELESRAEVAYETYSLVINVEARTMIDMASKQLIPAVVKYTSQLAACVNSIEQAGCDAEVQKSMLKEISGLLAKSRLALNKLAADCDDAQKDTGKATAEYYRDVITVDMAGLRAPLDKLELLVDEKCWPIPTYGDILFEV